MPLSPEDQKRMTDIKTNLGYVSDMLKGMQKFPGQISALEKLDTRGQEADYESFSMDELRDIYERGRVNSDINGCDIEHIYSPGNLQNVTLENGFETGEDGTLTLGTQDHPIETSRESLTMVINNWMHANDHAIDPKDIAAAQINVLGSIDRGLGGKIEKAKFDYMNLQEEIKQATGETFQDPEFEATYQTLKADAEKLIDYANQSQSSLALKGAASSIEAAGSQGYSAAKTALVMTEAKRFITGSDTGAIDLTGRNLSGLNLSQSDFSGIKCDAASLSRASGLRDALGIDPDLKAAALKLKPDVAELDALKQQQQDLRDLLPKNAAARLAGQISGATRQKEAQIDALEQQIQTKQSEIEPNNISFTPPARRQAVAHLTPNKPQPLPLHKQLETSNTYVVGAGALEPKVSSEAQNAMQKAQASETFKVSGSQVLSDKGATSAFAKKPIGSRTAALQGGGADDDALQSSLSKDADQIGTVSPLYGTAVKVGKCNAFDVPARLQAIEGDLTSLPSRSVASSVVNKALKMDSVAEEKFGVDLDGSPLGISVGVAGAAIRTRPSDPREAEAFLDINYADSQIQKGLFDLEAQDYITGQIDRHGGNIFIDPHTKEVRGIDNDLAFPVIDRAEMVNDGMVNNKAVATLPMFVHEDTAAKIMALSPEDLRKSLESINPPPGVGKLEPAAIDGACTRLVELQAHIQDLEARGALVKEFNNDTYAQAKAAQIELAGEPVLGGPNNGSIPRASYLGTAMIEKARTESLNGNENKPWEHRKLLDENDVPRAEVNEVYAQYQADVQQAREQISQNDPDLMRVKGEIAELQKDLNWQKQDAESMKSRVGAAERTNDPAQIKVANAAYEGALSTIEETQQKIAQKQERLEFLAEAKLENMKPRLAAKAYQIDVDKLGVEETNLQGELAVAQQDLAQAEEHIFEVLDQIANEGTSNREKFKLTQERIEEFQQQSEDAKFKIEKIQGQIEATQDKKAALEERIQTTLQQNPEWQRIAQPSANQERQFNIGERRNLGTPEIPGTSAERQPLERSARAVPPVTSQPGSLASNATESPAKVKTPARPELTHPGRPLPPIPGQEPKVNTAARPGLAHPGRPLPPIPGSEPKVEAAEVKAETPEKANTVKADMNADTETEKKDHSRKNSVGGDIKWKRPDSSGTSNERSVKDSIFRK